jgi:hypothetical protein
MSTDALAVDLKRTRREHDREAEHESEGEREETLSVVTTSLAAAATAWAAFQSTIWSGRQTFALARAEKLRTLSTEARLEGDQQLHIDVDLFIAYADAYASHDEALSKFLYDRFPPRMKKATDAWLALRAKSPEEAPLHPFAMKEYVLEAHARARALGSQADDEVAAASHANVTSDTYVLGTVILALVILLSSLGLRLRRRPPRRVMLVLSAAALIVMIAWLAMRPMGWVG